MRARVLIAVQVTCAILAQSVICNWAIAQSVDDTTIKNWVHATWSDAETFPVAQGMVLNWRVDDPRHTSEEMVASLRAKVAGKPDHPQAAELARLVRRLETKNYEEYRVSVIWRSESHWRYNQTWADKSWVDFVLTPNESWTLTSNQLRIFDPKNAKGADPEQAQQRIENIFLPECGRIYTGGMYAYRRSMFTLGSVTVHPNAAWTAELTGPADPTTGSPTVVLEMRGKWAQEHSRGFVETVIIVSSKREDSKGETEKYLDWKWDEELKQWVAGTVERVHPNGEVWRRLVHLPTQRSPASDEVVFGTPSVNATDPFRGKMTYISISDFRVGEKQDVSTGISESIEKSDLEIKNSFWTRRIGWIILFGVFATSAGVLLWRKYMKR